MQPKSLREALSAAKDERVRQEAEQARVAAEAERQRQHDAPRVEAEKSKRARISGELALEFVDIMKSHDIVPIGYYGTTRVKVREAGWDHHRDNSPMGYYASPRFAEYIEKPADLPLFLGWIAIKPERKPTYLDSGEPPYEVIPGVFVSEGAQTYGVDTRKHGDLEYVTAGCYGPFSGHKLGKAPLGEPDPTLLASDQAIEKMVALLSERGLA